MAGCKSMPLHCIRTADLLRIRNRCAHILMGHCACAQVAVDKGLFRMAPTPKAGPCLNTILQTALEIAEGLAFLHSCCVVHCDLSAGALVLMPQCSACCTPVGSTRQICKPLAFL